jgi:hypothetical protein
MSRLRPFREPLSYAALEAADLVRLADGLQVVIAEMAAQDRRLTARAIVEAQSADRLSQRLAGLAAYLNALAVAAPAEAVADIEAAVAGLTLAEQARRLSGLPSAAAPPHAAEDSDLTLF